MRCSLCNSDTHFRAERPQRSASAGTAFSSFVARADSAPLGDIVPTFVAQLTATASSTTSVVRSPAFFFGAADHAPGETRDPAARSDAIGAADSAPVVQPIVELPDSPMDLPSDASPSEPESSWSSWGWITNNHSWSFPGSSRAPSVPGPSAPPPPSTVSPVPVETPP